MRKRSGWVGGVLVLLAVLGLSLAGWADAPKADKPGAQVFTGKAVYISLKGNGGRLGLVDPEVKTLGERTFLTGRPVDSPTKPLRMWVPLSEVSQIEEFANQEEMAKWYRIEHPPKKE